MFEIRPIPAFDDNYIWLLAAADSHQAVIVDPGDADPVLETVERRGLQPVAILVTHHHGDHTGGVAELAQRFATPVYGPAGERIPALTHLVGEGDIVGLPALGLQLRVIDTPGHTRGHVCYTGHGALFCGDTLFSAGCGRLFEGTAAQMHASLEKLAALPDETLVYCAHEYTAANLRFALVVEPENPAIIARLDQVEALRARGEPTVPSTLGLEKRTNPFLRTAVTAVVAAAERFAGRRLTDGAEVFGTVRHWKDTLD